jgi:Zn-dependent protease
VLYYNFLLAVFNMLPIPPFDGSRILFAILPTKYYFSVMRYEKLMLLVVFLALWSGMLTGFFEVIVDAIITGVSGAVLLVIELFAGLFV